MGLSICKLILAALSVALPALCAAQNQLVVLRREHVEARWAEGDLIEMKLKTGEKARYRIGQIGPFYLVTPQLDTIDFAAIDRIKIKNGQRGLQTLSGAMIWGGLGYFAIDQFNRLLIVGGGNQFDEDVARVALPVAAGGLLLRLAKRKYYPLRGRKMLRITPTSPFYRPIY